MDAIMEITVNSKSLTLSGSTVADLVSQLGLPSDGVAVAVGTDIVPRGKWGTHTLEEGANVMIIKAASGG